MAVSNKKNSNSNLDFEVQAAFACHQHKFIYVSHAIFRKHIYGLSPSGRYEIENVLGLAIFGLLAKWIGGWG